MPDYAPVQDALYSHLVIGDGSVKRQRLSQITVALAPTVRINNRLSYDPEALRERWLVASGIPRMCEA